ncbi:MAG: S-layer homology domain-containing protein, partial [Oscillospiraceae bacterium]|nr:S-layer homology domain-containing protein [Oscillospiraceae bacterium]
MKKLFVMFLAMTLLLSALPFAGAAFKDEGFITAEYAKAVAAMSAQGIINGFEDGSFGPKKTLTRAQAAKILCVMLEGEKESALTKTETGFSDVPATHWAAKYVAYCVDKGIVAGVGNGKFDPNGQLSSAAFAKMLLVAYGKGGDGFTGAEWLQNVQAAAEKTFLLYNLGDKVTTGSIERQKAAQMA